MSADIVKMAVFDDRIVQQQPRYAVEKGALSVTNAPFNSIAANTGQHTYNILVPSENVFIDRALDWTSTCFLQMRVVFGNTAMATGTRPGVGTPNQSPYSAGAPLFQFGSGGAALAAFPLQTLTTTMTATINDTTVTINSADVLPQVLRMTDMKKNRLTRTCPTQLDKFALYDSAFMSINSPLQGFNEAMNVDEVPNGAFPSIWFTTASGAPLGSASTVVPTVADATNTVYLPNGAPATYTPEGGSATTIFWTFDTATGVPCLPYSLPAGSLPAGCYANLYFAFKSTEKLVLSPFVFSDVHEWDTGLFGCQNIQLVMNLTAPSRVLRSSNLQQVAVGSLGSGSTVVVAPGSVQYNVAAGQGSAFANSRVNLQFLTPSLDVPLPPKSVVPYMEFPRYISSGLQAITAGQGYGYPVAQNGLVLSSQTITLPTIPDMLIIYVRDANNHSVTTSYGGTSYSGVDTAQADWMLPIQGISVNFDNFAGLLSSHTTEQLYKMSVHNGLEMDWAQWSGVAKSTTPNATTPGSVNAGLLAPFANLGANLPTVGSMLVLKPGRDIVLQAGQAPSLVGNFVLQFNLTVANFFNQTVNPQIVVITANSGFFETIKGSSRVVKGVLTEQDIISAPVAPEATHGGLKRAVGGSVLGSLGNAMTRIRSHGGAFFDKVPALEKRDMGKMEQVGSGMGAQGRERKMGSGRSLKERLM